MPASNDDPFALSHPPKNGTDGVFLPLPHIFRIFRLICLPRRIRGKTHTTPCQAHPQPVLKLQRPTLPESMGTVYTVCSRSWSYSGVSCPSISQCLYLLLGYDELCVYVIGSRYSSSAPDPIDCDPTAA
ncbi:uncharacterized protein BO96DRAFT_228575 [Aspergillus niger CBS 101883]|uniref:uncharacterized protein n=1 Tax=Aspergillus lacticoffeatus (strain CBS 101883) TaxID=1450533 RepID=UPI000D7F0D6D|nr:uncharacterized protein BO96DRAFT_228575 [Aspergillus niger CBS 101883]PYH58843.1 hypothetical protein BO96DRAFT_228575 [Aspergillus niger CBS 101883]